MAAEIPLPVLSALNGTTSARARAINLKEERLTGGTGAATGEVIRLAGGLEAPDGHVEPFSIVSKTVRPLVNGRHAAHTNEPGHWAYWRREPLAYLSGCLPPGPGLRAPRCYGVVGNSIYMEDVQGGPEEPKLAARRLGAWHATAELPKVGWLARDQLVQRLAVTELDWSAVDADWRAVAIWEARSRLLDRLDGVTRVLSHGDFGTGNLVHCGGDTVVLDWGTLGSAAVGSDLAYLALSTLTDLSADYRGGLGQSGTADAAMIGYRATLSLVGTSRLHWMLITGNRVPPGYLDFTWENRPSL
jgi:hypothetical protein